MKKIGMFVFGLLLMLTIMVMGAKAVRASSDDIIKLDYASLARYVPNEDDFKVSRGESDIYYVNYDYTLLNGTTVHFKLLCKFYEETLYTPNGTDVSMPSGTDPRSYFVVKYLNDLPDSVKYDIEINNSNNYNLIQTNGAPTTSYNCHSFAWYCQNSSINDVWIQSPTAYYYDFSYESVNSPRVGDIICYYDNNGTLTEADDINLHSGIIIGLSGESSNGICGDSNMYIVESKWGMEGLYTHKGDECPYTINHGGSANYVRYYRPRTNSSYTLTTLSNDTVSFYANGNGSIINKYAMYELDTTGGNFDFSISSNKQLDVRLYDLHMQLVDINDSVTGTYTNSFFKTLESGKYYLRVAFQDISQSGTISTHINSHTHTYSASYIWKNQTQHIAKCSCGLIRTEYHVVLNNSLLPGQQYSTCILCGGQASIGIVHRNLRNPGSGSFILSNGVIVLDENDIDAFLNNNISFALHDNSSQINNNLYYLTKRKDYILLEEK